MGKGNYVRLPDAGSLDFGTKYATFLGVRKKRQALSAMMTFKDWPTTDIDRADIRALLGDLTPGAATMQLNVARNIFNFGRKNDLVDHDTTKDIEIDHESAPHEPWPEAIIERALFGPARIPVALLYFTGQRIGELCKMRWSDIDDGVITVVQQKTGKELYVPLHGRLTAIMAATPRSLTTIVCNAIGKPYSPSALRKVLRKHVGDYVPHGLRKNAVNALLEAGCSAAMVSSLTGQTMQIVEPYAAKRNNRKLAKTAMGKWNGNG